MSDLVGDGLTRLMRGGGLWLLVPLLAACALFGGTEQPEPDPVAPTPPSGNLSPTEGPTGDDTDPPLLEYRREGGIAGFCDRIEIRVPIAIWESCAGLQQEIALTPNQQARLLLFATRYRPFEEETADNPGGPDNLRQALIFNGGGEEPLTDEARQQLYDLVGDLAAAALAGGS